MIRPQMNIAQDRYEYLAKGADDMGLTMAQFCALVLVAGIRSLQRGYDVDVDLAEQLSGLPPDEVGEVLKSVGVAPLVVAMMQDERERERALDKSK